jgi:hypothetical protein
VRQETETLGIVEPLDSTFDHLRTGLLSLRPGCAKGTRYLYR